MTPGIDVPILVLSEPPPDAMTEALRAALTPTVYTDDGHRPRPPRGRRRGPATAPWSVHLKIDTGMHRVGAHPARCARAGPAHRRPARAWSWAGRSPIWRWPTNRTDPRPTSSWIGSTPVLAELESRRGSTRPASRRQLGRGSSPTPRALRPGPGRHRAVRASPRPASSAGDRSRCEPAMSLRAEVTLVKQLAAGEGVSYGLRHVFDRTATVATVPLGYADGVPRRLGTDGGEVLIGGVRRPDPGRGHDGPAHGRGHRRARGAPRRPGRAARCAGERGITAQEWADRLDTIAYEVVCGFSVRLPRQVRPHALSATLARRRVIQARAGAIRIGAVGR